MKVNRLIRILLTIEGLTDEKIQQLAQGYDEKIQQLAQGYEPLDADGRYRPFCAAIAYILQQYFIT